MILQAGIAVEILIISLFKWCRNTFIIIERFYPVFQFIAKRDFIQIFKGHLILSVDPGACFYRHVIFQPMIGVWNIMAVIYIYMVTLCRHRINQVSVFYWFITGNRKEIEKYYQETLHFIILKMID